MYLHTFYYLIEQRTIIVNVVVMLGLAILDVIGNAISANLMGLNSIP